MQLLGGSERLSANEIGQGIVAPQDSLNAKGRKILGGDAEVGDGIFVLRSSEVERLNLSPREMNLLKPYFTSKPLHRYWMEKRTRLSVVYTDSSFRDVNLIEPFPNLKRHFDKYAPVITSHNGPYGLHRAR